MNHHLRTKENYFSQQIDRIYPVIIVPQQQMSIEYIYYSESNMTHLQPLCRAQI